MGCGTQFQSTTPDITTDAEIPLLPVFTPSKQPLRVCIIGAAHAGTAAAVTIRNFDKTAKITLFERNNCVSFLQCGIHIAIMNDCANIDKMFYNSVDNLKRSGINVNYLCEVVQFDFGARNVYFKDLRTDALSVEPYDRLILALGSRPQIPKFLTAKNDRLLQCKNYDDTARLLGLKKHKIAILGAGPIGVELAYAFTQAGGNPILIDQSSHILQRYFIDLYTSILEQEFAARGCKICLEQEIKLVNCIDGGVEITLGEEFFTVEYVIMAAGFAPATQTVLQSDSMKQFQHKNGVLAVNSSQETSIPNVYAAGDCCDIFSNVRHESVFQPLATNAIRQGAVAAHQILGNSHIKMHGTQGSFGMHVFDYCLACTGMTMEDASKQGDNVVKLVISEPILKDFQVSDEDIGSITLIYDEVNYQILGCQIMSNNDIAGVIDLVSTAIYGKVRLDELAMSEWAYCANNSQFIGLLQSACLAAVMSIPRFTEDIGEEYVEGEVEGEQDVGIVY